MCLSDVLTAHVSFCKIIVFIVSSHMWNSIIEFSTIKSVLPITIVIFIVHFFLAFLDRDPSRLSPPPLVTVIGEFSFSIAELV